jgi:hypothetical protein
VGFLGVDVEVLVCCQCWPPPSWAGEKEASVDLAAAADDEAEDQEDEDPLASSSKKTPVVTVLARRSRFCRKNVVTEGLWLLCSGICCWLSRALTLAPFARRTARVAVLGALTATSGGVCPFPSRFSSVSELSIICCRASSFLAPLDCLVACCLAVSEGPPVEGVGG